ncbi:MAG: glucose-1-phosphate thymidylyltransferase [Chitinophagaceae bacterium]|nr:MAG: glucose-1-phosphate thymidylyltransferase [Chitinophagaceae bacterium]
MLTKLFFISEYVQAEYFHPFSLTKAIEDLPIGILSNRERWEKILGTPSISIAFEPFKKTSISDILKMNTDVECFLFIEVNVLPTQDLIDLIINLKLGECIQYQNKTIVQKITAYSDLKKLSNIQIENAVLVDHKWQLISSISKTCIQLDIALLNLELTSLPETVQSKSNKDIYIDKSAQIGYCFMNTDEGPIYIGKNAKVLDGAMLRGPLVVNDNAVVKMGATIYGSTVIGKHSVVGGEIKNSIIFEHSNKAHDGYIGDAIIAEWCNLGAGTICSNVKNTAATMQFQIGDLIFETKKAGVHMGAYSKTAINTAINTGTEIGVGANVFGSGLTPKKSITLAGGWEEKKCIN